MTAWTFVDQFGGALLEALGLGGWRRVTALDVEPQKLLHAADDAGLGDGWERARDYANGVDAGALQDRRQFSLFGVGAPEAAEKGLAAEAREVHGDVCCTTRSLVSPGVPKGRNRGLGRDALYVAMDVAVEHDVADYQHLELAEAALQQVQNRMKFRQHAREDLLGTIIASPPACHADC